MNFFSFDEIRAAGDCVAFARDTYGATVASGRCNAAWRGGDGMNVSIDREKWFDHVQAAGGGIIQLAAFKFAGDKQQAQEYLGSLYGLEPKNQTGKQPDKSKKRIVATYDYTDASGKMVFQVVRYVPKDFIQLRPDGNGGFVWNMKGVKKILYRLPQVLAAKEAGRKIFLVEGEKDVHALESIGLTATCNPGGAVSINQKIGKLSKWETSFTSTLTGATVIIIADPDAPGRNHAALVAGELHGMAVSVKVLELPDRNGQPVKDAHDWIKAGGTAEELHVMLEAAPAWKPADGRAEIETLAENTPATNDPEPWEKPIGFDAPVNLPPFPAEVLPEPFKSFVLDVAASKQVPPALPGAATLAAVALAAAKNYRVYIGKSHDEPLNIYSLSLMEPGSRKSDTFRACLAPVENFEIEQFQAVKPEIAKAQERRQIEESRLAEIRKRAGRCDDPEERRRLTLEAEEIAAAMTEIPNTPRLLASDVTPEHLTSLLCANGGRMAVADAEGGLIFEIMAGRYSKNGGCNIEIFLKGHAGDAVRVDRTGRPPEYARSAALTCILTGQPEILRNMASKEQMRGRGLLARFLYTMPSGLIGGRDYGNTPMQPQLVEAYAARLRELLHIPPLDPDDPEAHRRLNLDGEALEIWRQYHDRIEHAQAADGELAHMRDFASKLPGAVARLAAILHLMQHGATPPADIAPETTAAAWALGMFFLEHTKAAFAEMGSGGDIGLARRVFGWICRHRPRRFTLGELFNDLRRGSGLDRSEDLLPAMEILEDRNIIRREPPPPKSRPGRKSFGSYEVNPEIVSGAIL